MSHERPQQFVIKSEKSKPQAKILNETKTKDFRLVVKNVRKFNIDEKVRDKLKLGFVISSK